MNNIENIIEETSFDNEAEECGKIVFSQQWKDEMMYGNTYYAAQEWKENFDV